MIGIIGFFGTVLFVVGMLIGIIHDDWLFGTIVAGFGGMFAVGLWITVVVEVYDSLYRKFNRNKKVDKFA